MFHVPDTYKVDVKVALKDFIPRDVKPKDKKKIKNKKEVLTYDI